MDIYEIELEQGDLFIRWIVTFNGERLATGIEYGSQMALEKAQHAVDLHSRLFQVAA
jgi:hypothetical protein